MKSSLNKSESMTQKILNKTGLTLLGVLLSVAVGLSTLILNKQAYAQAPSQQIMNRHFPPNARLGEMVIIQPPIVTLNGKSARLSPGGRIRNENNLIVTPASLANQTLPILFTQDTLGQIHDVWVLSNDEVLEVNAQIKAAKQAGETCFLFICW